jgi:hypothetical protein
VKQIERTIDGRRQSQGIKALVGKLIRYLGLGTRQAGIKRAIFKHGISISPFPETHTSPFSNGIFLISLVYYYFYTYQVQDGDFSRE